ncbi:MAG: PKD domain-containing protein [Bacteroidetes bacterium]|nr:PKD domain-containing protein [Bacteroidota bacterium]
MNLLPRISILFLAIIFMGIGQQALGQRSEGGLPPSFLISGLDNTFDTRAFPAPDMNAIYAEDEQNAVDAFPKPYRVGVSVPVNLSIENSGTWTELPDGDKIWRLTLVSEGAMALGVYYDDFWLPYGGKLFLYNEKKDQVIGAFTEENNNPDCMFATQLVQGDKVTLEYYHPAGTEIMPNLAISEIAYNYRGVSFDYVEKGGSLWCMINIICSPEGDNWQDEKKGVVKQYMKIGWGYYLCTGSLINNTAQDKTPYVLTAFHCGEGATVADMNQWVFYYNYESSTCTGNWGPSTQSQTGCAKKAEGDYEPGSDFLLLQLNYGVPASYSPYFNGWDRRNVPADSGVSIHHPAGDIKKISTFTLPAASSQWNNYGVLSHWRVWWAETTHGTSITEGGSSGSPLFNQDGRIVGDLTGGPPDDCEDPLYSLYGKLSYSWDQMGSLPSQQLKPWLDPLNTGVEVWDGMYNPTAPSPGFSADVTSLQPGESVQFTDMTAGNCTEWEWTFEGGDPATYSGQNPPLVTYAAAGRFDVSLTTSSSAGSATKDSLEMIIVGAPETDFTANNTYLQNGESVNFEDISSNDPIEWLWEFPGGVPETSTDQDPQGIQYDETGNYNVTLTATNQYGDDMLVKEAYITVGGPFAEFEADQTSILAGESVTFADLSINDPTNWSWKFFGGSPGAYTGQTPPAVTYNNPGEYDVKLTVSNDLGSHYIQKSGYIIVGGVGVNEFQGEDPVVIFPNPSKGNFTVKVEEGINRAIIHVINAIGLEVSRTILEEGNTQVTLDLSGEANGIYFLRLEYDGKSSNHKLYLMK